MSWLYVQPLPQQLGSFAGNIKLKVPKAGLSEIHPVDLADIAKGLALLNATSSFDIGQAAVVADGRVIAIEAAEGTDEMLSRVAQWRRSGQLEQVSRQGVLIKAAKLGQDRRLDLPSIGPQTVEGAKRAGLTGIAATAGSTIVANPDRIAAAADHERLFVIGVREPG